MRIYFITSKLNFKTSGGSISDLDLRVRAFQEFGNDVAVVTAFGPVNSYSDLPYAVLEENVRSKRLAGIQWGIFKILRKYSQDADIFYIDGQFLYGAGLYRKLGGRVPVVACFNRELVCWPENVSSLFPYLRKGGIFFNAKKVARRWIERAIGVPFANAVDIFTFTNPCLRKSYERFGLLAKDEKTIIVGDCFDYRAVMKENNVLEDFYVERNVAKPVCTLFYSSRMVPGKGFDLLLAAFSRVKNKERFRLILGGSGPEEPLVRQAVRDFKLEPYVLLSGWVSSGKLLEFYRTADIFVQARWRTDMTSMSLVQAMTFGLPSILPGGGGLEWAAGKCARYFKDGDPIDLAVKIEELGTNVSLRSELSKSCFERLASDEMNYRIQMRNLNERLKSLTVSAK